MFITSNKVVGEKLSRIETIMDTINVNGVMYETQPIHLPKNYLEQFNFIDLGQKHGQMKDYCSRMFGTDNGLHIEMDEDHIKVLEERKYLIYGYIKLNF